MMVWHKLMVPCAIALAVAACENKPTLHPDFGNSVRHNQAVHIVNPRIADPNAQAPAFSGERARGAMDRYNTGNVKEIEKESTTSQSK